MGLFTWIIWIMEIICKFFQYKKNVCRSSCARWSGELFYPGIQGVVTVNIKLTLRYFSYYFITALTALHDQAACLSLVIGETAYQPIVTKWWFFFFNVPMFPTMYDKYDCNTICPNIYKILKKNKIHSLVYQLGYCEAISKYEFIFHIIFSFLMASVRPTLKVSSKTILT